MMDKASDFTEDPCGVPGRADLSGPRADACADRSPPRAEGWTARAEGWTPRAKASKSFLLSWGLRDGLSLGAWTFKRVFCASVKTA